MAGLGSHGVEGQTRDWNTGLHTLPREAMLRQLLHLKLSFIEHSLDPSTQLTNTHNQLYGVNAIITPLQAFSHVPA